MSSDRIHSISQDEEPCSQKCDEDEDDAGEECDREAISCSALCSLGAKAEQTMQEQCESSCPDGVEGEDSDQACSSSSKMNRKLPMASINHFCPKQLQLPMFLSKTFHMIDKCDNEIACWSEAGDNFVVKNVEKFASVVLPLYFKHSNFSSFARQLNFYGFRKLRSEAILTAEVDPCSACFVRFYHENFHRDKPDLLTQIKRATKGDQQSKDDVESLRIKIYDLKDALRSTVCDYDRKLSELSHEWNHRFNVMKAEQEKLVALVQRVLEPGAGSVHGRGAPSYSNRKASVSKAMPIVGSAVGNLGGLHSSGLSSIPTKSTVTDLLHSLSQAAVSLDDENERMKHSGGGEKRSPPDNGEMSGNKKRAAPKSKRN